MDDLLKNSPKEGEYWFAGHQFREFPIVHLLERDNQKFRLLPEDPLRMEMGWRVEVVHSGKRLFLPNRLLGSRANAMEVLAWAAC
jgi:hypothetical protein